MSIPRPNGKRTRRPNQEGLESGVCVITYACGRGKEGGNNVVCVLLLEVSTAITQPKISFVNLIYHYHQVKSILPLTENHDFTH